MINIISVVRSPTSKKEVRKGLLFLYLIEHKVQKRALLYYNESMNLSYKEYEKNKTDLIDHAKSILAEDVSGTKLSKGLGISVKQVNLYRRNEDLIQNATAETLLKFEDYFTKNTEERSNEIK